ncbi:MAG: thiol-disulfide oxidoreductase DCC family protein [Candidatus Binatia bacterium]
MENENVKGVEKIFFDGHCGMCHRFVRFVLARDGAGLFHFAPLDSDAFRSAVPETRRTNLGDSLVVLTAENRLLTRSTAVLHVVRRLGGFWQ